MPKLIPLFDRLLIEFTVDPDAPIDTVGGIITPEGYKPRPEGTGFPYYTAKVVAVGSDVKHVVVGDMIAIPRDRVEKFSVGTDTFWQCTEKAVAGVVITA